MKDVVEREIVLLQTQNGRTPFEEWFDSLADRALSRAVDVRLNRIADGNFGDHKMVGHGVY